MPLTIDGRSATLGTMGFERMGEHKTRCGCGGGTKTVWSSEMDDWNRKQDGGEAYEDDDCQTCAAEQSRLIAERSGAPREASPIEISIRWTSNRAPSADPPGSSLHEVFINGVRGSVHVLTEVAQRHDVASIQAVAEKKIRTAWRPSEPPPSVNVTPADFG